MEQRFFHDGFENFLKETVDDFRMYPSKKVWTSIYNNIHPARKWPTLGIFLLLISSIAFIDASNNYVPRFEAVQGNGAASQAIASETHATIVSKPQHPATETDLNNTTAAVEISSTTVRTSNNIHQPSPQLAFLENALEELDKPSGFSNNWQLTGNVGEKELASFDQQQQLLATVSMLSTQGDEKPAVDDTESTGSEGEETETDNSGEKQIRKRKKGNLLSYQFYATPSIGYRSLSANTDLPDMNQSAMMSNPDQPNAGYSHAGAINLETGANILVRVNDVIRIKGGVQLNYTNYYVNAYPLNHPTQTALLMNGSLREPVLLSRTSMLGAAGSAEEVQSLSNNTYQVSLPVGADVRIAGNQTIQWFAGATIQPTYVAGGNAFLLSADQKNYIPDASLLRKFNMNGGIETFVSYRLRENLMFNAGPQFRYQFLSSYTKDFSYDEKLYNIGVKLGVTTKF